MAISRVVLGVHFPSDIVAGAALGTAVGTIGRRAG
jgi:membrane-associated phospholipid phosphatase